MDELAADCERLEDDVRCELCVLSLDNLESDEKSDGRSGKEGDTPDEDLTKRRKKAVSSNSEGTSREKLSRVDIPSLQESRRKEHAEPSSPSRWYAQAFP